MPINPIRQAAAFAALQFVESGREIGRVLGPIFGTSDYTIAKQLLGVSKEAAAASLAGLMNEQEAGPKTLDDHVEVARLKKQLAEAEARAKDIALALDDARNLREAVLSAAGEPLKPSPIAVKKQHDGALTWLLLLSDNHLGKKIRPEEVAGLQSYDVAIARARIHRTFERGLDMIRRNGERIDRILVICLGDNTNGALRHDDDRSNEIPPIQQSRAFAECVRDGADFLKEHLECDIDIHFLPGNHGRTTANPPSVEIGENFDCIAGMLVEWHFSGDDRVSIYNTGQADALLDIYGRGYLLTHGDRIGAKGGDGQIGALGPTKRGSLRIGAQELEIGRYVADRPQLAAVFMGHFHYHWTDYDVYVSGAACGPDPWAFTALRAKPKPPYQWLIGIHPEMGIVEEKRLFVGHPSEGPICR